MAELGFCFDASGKKGGGGSSNVGGLGTAPLQQQQQQQLNHAAHMNGSYQLPMGPIDPTGDTDALLNASHHVMASTQFMGSVGVDFGNLT